MNQQLITRDSIRDQQNNALITRSFNRGKVIGACGIGKTALQLVAHEVVNSQLTLVVVPFISLISQNLDEFKSRQTRPKKYLIVCSDADVSNDPKDIVSMEQFQIVDFMEGEGEKIIFTTYKSAPLVSDCYRRFTNLPRFDLIIFDEAHLAASNREDATYATALSDHNIPANLRLFYTATERISDDEEGFSMDNENVFGKDIVNVSNAQAVNSGIIKGFEVVSGLISTSTAQELVNKNKILGTESGNVSAESTAKNIVLAKAILAKDIKTCMVFHNKIDDAIQGAKDGNIVAKDLGIGHMKHIAISSLDGVAAVNEAFELLRGGNVVLHNVRIGAIGINLKNLDAVFFSCARSSILDITQIVGRTQRKIDANDTKPSYVIVPLISDDALVIDGFKKLLRVLSNIAQNIPLVSFVGNAARNAAPIQSGRRSSLQLLVCDEALSQEFIDSVQLSINSQFKREHERRLFEERAKEYAAYIEEHIDYPTTNGEHSTIARWAYKIRMLDVSGNLQKEQKQIVLDALPEFVWGKQKVNGAILFQKLAIAKVHFRVHGKHLPTDHEISWWFRKLSRPGERRLFNISDEMWDQVEEQLPGFLESIGILYIDGLTNSLKDLFIKKIHVLKKYVDEHGHFPNSNDNLALHMYRKRLNADLNKGKFPERKEWLNQNWPQYFATPSYAAAVAGRVEKRPYEQFERKVEKYMHLAEMPLRGKEGYGFCVFTKTRLDKGELAPYEFGLVKKFMPWLING